LCSVNIDLDPPCITCSEAKDCHAPLQPARGEAALEEAKRGHQSRVKDIEKARTTLDRRSEAEEARWKKERDQLETALRKARSAS
jgi:hypothetical protein